MIPARSALLFIPLFCLLFSADPLAAQNKDEAMELYYSANALYNRKLGSPPCPQRLNSG